MSFNKAQGTQLAFLIRQWLTSTKQGAPEGELLNFVNDLENAQNVGVWAGVNYERIIPFKNVISAPVRLLLIFRNALIFLPIVVTWFAIERAANSWTEQGTNFLQHWQNMDGFFSFKYVAWFDSGVIAVLVILTVLTGFLEESDKGQITRERQYQGLMIALERDLSGYRYLSLQDINNAAADTLSALQSSTQLVESAAQSFADSSQQAHDAIVGANDVVHRTFSPAVQRLDDTISALSAAASVHKDMVTVVQTVQQDFATQMNTLKQGVIDVLSSVDARTSQILHNMDGQVSTAASTLMSTAQTAMADVSKTAQSVASSASQQIGQQMQAVAANLDQAVRSLQSLSDSLDRTISNLNSTSNGVMVNTATLADDLNQIHQALQQTVQRLPR
jgi:prefoldin subunit 5